jgi:5,10-methylenetetrahydromethanopterin reductase
MGGANLPQGPLSNLIADYLTKHASFEPADAKYLHNHRGHLMFVRPEETHITPELVKSTSMSGTRDELIERLRAIKDQGYSQVTVQLVHGHESALEDWASVFEAV